MILDIGINIFYEKVGSGKPIILLHGNGQDHNIFNKLAEKLKTHYTLYLIDSRNHGKSDKTGDYSYESMADDLYKIMIKLDIKKADIIGFSDGAVTSILFALKHPNMITKMAILGANLSPEDFTDEAYNYVKNTYNKTKNPLFKLMLEQPNIDINSLKNIKIPSLVIGAANDIYKPEVFVNLSKALPESELYILEDHNHDSYINNNDILYDKLCSFFD